MGFYGTAKAVPFAGWGTMRDSANCKNFSATQNWMGLLFLRVLRRLACCCAEMCELSELCELNPRDALRFTKMIKQLI